MNNTENTTLSFYSIFVTNKISPYAMQKALSIYSALNNFFRFFVKKYLVAQPAGSVLIPITARASKSQGYISISYFISTKFGSRI